MIADRGAGAKVLGELQARACVVIGTRPGTVMLAPVIRELGRRSVPHFVLHTGQHYSYNMDQIFLEELQLPAPAHRLDGIDANPLHGAQTAAMLSGCEQVIRAERPSLVLVGGDSNTNLAAALAARKLHVQVGHIEAGERSLDWRMPEEHNRVVIDHISEYLFVTGPKSRENLERENVRGRIVDSGNPIVDAIHQHIATARARSDILDRLGMAAGRYLLMTVHREENADSPQALRGIIDGVALLGRELGLPIVFPVHPRTERNLRDFGLAPELAAVEGLVLCPPLGYSDFLLLTASASLVLTDSGGVQQEACILRVPCVTLRETTEWTETLALGSNVLAGTKSQEILKGGRLMVKAARSWNSPFGDGRAAERIVDTVVEALDPGSRWTGPGRLSIERAPA